MGRGRALLVAVPVVAAVAMAGFVWRSGVSSSPTSPPPTSPSSASSTGTEPAPIVVTSSSIFHFDDLESMVAGSDAVVIGRVTGTERGRVVTAGSGDGFVTRLVDLQVDEVLAGPDPGPSIVVEEEGWLLDGTPLLVDGAPGSATGDRGVYFLHAPPGVDQPYWTVINSQGRYLADPADGTHQLDLRIDDPLVHRLQAQDPAWLRHQVQAAASAVGRSPTTQE